MAKFKTKTRKPRTRYGIGEWYGGSFIHLDLTSRTRLAKIQKVEKKKRPKLPCPFKNATHSPALCTKEGGVCSIRLYRDDPITGVVSPVPDQAGSLVATCPYRFQQDGLIYKWIGETLLSNPFPLIVREVGFLEQEAHTGAEAGQGEDVGRIDNVLIHSEQDPMQWCALEIQAVYFSGASMSKEFKKLRTSRKESVPFPVGNRHPDYRSSGPKRLMPQLQIKVPTLRRWGKKMAVVVDRSFFEALGAMDNVRDVSNCDIAWFVVDWDETQDPVVLRPSFFRLTTLERAVEGLTGGSPVSVEVFETRIRQKLAERNSTLATS